MNIETKWLEDFLSLAHTHSFSQSAKERHMTQPAFSRRIKALEAAVGCELIDRASMPVTLTAEGLLFQMTARNLVSQLSDSIHHLQSMKQQGVNTLNFAVSHTLSLSLFPTFLHSFQQALTGVNTRQLVANVDDCAHALKNGLCEFLLAFEEPTLSSEYFHHLELQTVQLVPVCRGDEEGRAIFDLDAADPVTVPYLGYPKDIFLGRCVEQLLRRRPRTVTLNQVFESPLADSLKIMAMQGIGIAWVPSFAIREELQQGLLVICGETSWQLPLTVCLYRSCSTLPSVAEDFWLVCKHKFSK
ncbi:LysR substrate-binding domain-containing protein [Oceanisphaera pacifica]|uniref:LysR family transcriptional regulator n=1 Tax=Oceanisphaera pacifica TaxID=2818389 RepID=A0ABS3NHE1_9GAMM|nr:LysR substrate-binding domain-containing protein [Oceanisphaera pacifica]MBO1519998.1 LysR family transcriptional regulator [Oceanisphaera pacifica]